MKEQIKFKRVLAGEYETTYKGYTAEISKNYDSSTWSATIWSPSGSLFAGECLETYASCKHWIQYTLD